MKKFAPWLVLAGVLMGVGAYRFRTRPYDAARLMQCLPPDRSLHVYLDVGLLRSSGILDLIAGSPGLEEPDYKQFVEGTGFDYRTDLDAVAIAFRDDDIFYAVQGRFDEQKLMDYARSHGGSCEHVLCSLPGSTPGRTTSFYMIRAGVLALASSHGPSAGDMIAPGAWTEAPKIPTAAIWVSAPPYVFANPESLPTGSRAFLAPLAQARQTYFTLGPGSGDGFALKMEVTTDTAKAAEALRKDLADNTELLNSMLRREKMTPNAGDLSGVLTKGEFVAAGPKVTATWPIERSFVEALAKGGVTTSE